MDIYITLDYELFFGNASGSVENCMLKPTRELKKITDAHQVKLNFFVDAGYLVKLKEQKKDYPELKGDFEKVSGQLKELSSEGHSIELHIHPHWEDSYFDGKTWKFDTSRYKLANFSEVEIAEIVKKYTETLKEITGKNPVAYRAGGWSAQPFSKIGKHLKENGVVIDSSAFPQGFYQSKEQDFDFRDIKPYQTDYRFSDELTKVDSKGDFLEIPISSYKLSPVFFWKFAFHKLFSGQNHLDFGDGAAISKAKKEVLRLMASPSFSVVSIDGYKASFIEKAFKKYIEKTENEGSFVLIGHPKAFSEFSLQRTEEFISKNAKTHYFKTFSEIEK